MRQLHLAYSDSSDASSMANVTIEFSLDNIVWKLAMAQWASEFRNRQSKAPDRTANDDKHLIEIASELGATHLMFPAYADGYMLMEYDDRFHIVAQWGRMDDGKYWVSEDSGTMPLDGRDKMLALSELEYE